MRIKERMIRDVRKIKGQTYLTKSSIGIKNFETTKYSNNFTLFKNYNIEGFPLR